MRTDYHSTDHLAGVFIYALLAAHAPRVSETAALERALPCPLYARPARIQRTKLTFVLCAPVGRT